MTSPDVPPALDLQGLCVQRGGVPLLDHVSLRLHPGSMTGLVGESGSGKTLTALALMGLLPQGIRVSQGTAHLANGTDLLALAPASLRAARGRQVAMVFQEPLTALNPLRQVGDALLDVMRSHPVVHAGTAREHALQALARVGIPDPAARLHAWPHQLSGGMRQRVLLALALCAGPSVLLADEPTTALDVTVQAHIMALLTQLAQRDGLAILFITHDLTLLAAHARDVAVLYAGSVVEHAHSERVLRAPRHPYTRALLQCSPSHPASQGPRLQVLPGSPPEPGRWPQGCRFAPRCSRVTQRCLDEVPALRNVDLAHQVACHHPLETPA